MTTATPCASQTLLVPAANQKDSNQVSTLAGDPATDAGEIFNTKGISDNKILSHSYSGTIQKEEGKYQNFATCVTQARKTLPLPLEKQNYIPPISLPYHTHISPLGKPWLDAPLQDKAEQS